MMRWLAAMAAGLLLLVQSSAWAETAWEKGRLEVERFLVAGIDAYRAGDAARADHSFSDAYFVAYEASGLEIAVRQFISAKRNYQLERKFRDLRLLVDAKAPVGEVEARADQLRKDLAEAVQLLDGRNASQAFGASPPAGSVSEETMRSTGAGNRGAFIQSFTIIFREGIEAILIISALIAYLGRIGRKREIKAIYLATGLAVAASLMTAYLFKKVMDVSPASQEVLEGMTLLLASLVLFYVSYWLISKTAGRKWQEYIQEKAGEAVSGGRIAALSAVAFLAVYREGAETVLFYQALAVGEGGAASPLWGGFAAGCLALVLVFLLFRGAMNRFPLRPFFAVTSLFLYYLAFVFAGKGIRELQEGDVLRETAVPFVPHVEWAGIYPTLEGVVMQALFLVALIYVVLKFRKCSPPPTPSPVAPFAPLRGRRNEETSGPGAEGEGKRVRLGPSLLPSPLVGEGEDGGC